MAKFRKIQGMRTAGDGTQYCPAGDYYKAEAKFGKGVVFAPTGEYRAPRKGEWYISGAEPEAYLAPNDLATAFDIAKPMRITRDERVRLSPA